MNIQADYSLIDSPPNKVTKQPVVSVCVQTYQHVDYIAECLDSILMQKTSFDFEILLGEDDSSDGTRDICIKYAKKHPEKIKLFLHSRKNVINIEGNPTGRFNLTHNLQNSNGKYIALCEGDDYWSDPLKLEKQVRILEKHPECIACHHWHKYQQDGQLGSAPLHGFYPETVANVKRIFENKLRIKTRTVLYRNIFKNTALPDWFYNVAFGDVPLSFIMGKYGNFYFLNEEMAVYRITGKGISNIDDGKDQYHFLRNKKWVTIWENALIYHNYDFAEVALPTIKSFYQKIIKNEHLSFNLILKLFFFSTFRSKLGLKYRFSVFASILKQIIYKNV